MDADLNKNNMVRRPQWRADRVMELVENPKLRLRRSDDIYVRSYRRLRSLQAAAGIDQTKRFFGFVAQPYSWVAEAIYYTTDGHFRHILEGHLLTQESIAEIAGRLKIEENTVAHYEAIFFSVIDLRQNTDAIDQVILGPPGCFFAGVKGVMTDNQRGFLYRLFAYYGGPDLLEAVIETIGPTTMHESREDVVGWLDTAVDQIVQVSTVAASRAPRLDKDPIVRLLEIALATLQTAKTSKLARRRPPCDFERLVAMVLAKLTHDPGPGSKMPE